MRLFVASSGSAHKRSGEVDDADRGVAIGRDVHEPADGLRARRRVRGKQSAGGMREAEMDQDGGAFGEHRTIGKLERGDLAQRVDAAEFVESWTGW